jgi:hypothetical protein
MVTSGIVGKREQIKFRGDGWEEYVVLRSATDKRNRYQRLWDHACLFGPPHWTRDVPEYLEDSLIEEMLDDYAKHNDGRQ